MVCLNLYLYIIIAIEDLIVSLLGVSMTRNMTGLVAGTAYAFQVAAVNGAGIGAFSGTALGTTSKRHFELHFSKVVVSNITRGESFQ